MDNIENLISKLNAININSEAIIKIQSLWRGYSVRKKLKSATDKFTLDILKKYIKLYVERLKFVNEINQILDGKKYAMKIFHVKSPKI